MEVTTTIPDQIQSIEVILGLKGDQGLSAYEVWKQLPGNGTGTEEDFFEALRGVGITGATVDENGHMVIQYDDGRQTETELQPIVQAIAYRDQAEESATESANSAEDALRSAEQAKASEEASEIQATASANSAQESSNYAEQANAAMDAASKSAEQSGQFASNAASSATAAKQSADNAKDSETNARQSESNAGNSASQASQSAAEAGNSADAAVSAEENASRSMDMAQKWAEATDSPDGTSDSDSSTGKTQSSRSWALYSKDRALAAENSATNAAMSEVDASASAIQANQSENNAKQSETNAASSASNAAQSATSAKQNADTVLENINTAVTKAGEAANSATDASASASQASTSATNAASSASSALASENKAKEYAAQAREVVEGLSSAYVYMGSVNNYSDLPTESLKTGYMYNVINADPDNQIKAGDNVVWNGEAWDNLSGYVDLSGLAQKTELPTRTSDLTNDSGYITAADDITGNAATATHVEWNGVTGKPSTFSPSQHTHPSTEVTGLATVAVSGSYNDLMDIPEPLDTSNFARIDAINKFTQNNSFAGVSYFNGAVVVPTPTQGNNPATKGYVDGKVAAADEKIDDILYGNSVAGKAERDGLGNIIDETYATKSELEGVTIDDSNFAKLNQTNTFTGSNTFQGTFTVTTSKTFASGTPTSNNHIANKKYVDDTVSEAVDDIVSGTTIVGKAKDSLSCEWSNVKNKPILATVATSGSYHDLTDTPADVDTSDFAKLDSNNTFTGHNTFSGDIIVTNAYGISTVNFESARKVVVPAPIANNSAATVAYVDSKVGSINIDDSNFAKLNQENTFGETNVFNGAVSFNNTTVVGTVGSNPLSIVNKRYVDDAVSEISISELEIVKITNPVGTIRAFNNTFDPNTTWAGTTWQRFGQGRVLVGAGQDGGTNFTLGSKGGEEKHTLSVGEMPSHGHGATVTSAGGHTHTSPVISGSAGNGTYLSVYKPSGSGSSTNITTSSSGGHNHTVNISNTGSSQAHNNMQPYVVVNYWVRTA